jgi:hypothetical protein
VKPTAELHEDEAAENRPLAEGELAWLVGGVAEFARIPAIGIAEVLGGDWDSPQERQVPIVRECILWWPGVARSTQRQDHRAPSSAGLIGSLIRTRGGFDHTHLRSAKAVEQAKQTSNGETSQQGGWEWRSEWRGDECGFDAQRVAQRIPHASSSMNGAERQT